MKKLLFFLVLNLSLMVCQTLSKRNQLNCDDMNMLKRKLSIFRINVRNWEIDLVSKGVSDLTGGANQRLFKFVDRNVTSDESQCNVMSPQHMCAQKTVRRTFPNHFPSAMIEKQCTCDKCHSIGHQSPFLNSEFACQPIFEREAVLVKENARQCMWTEYLRLKVVGCQCIIRRNVKQF